MISKMQHPTSKHAVARSIIELNNPKIEVFEVVSGDDVRAVTKAIERHGRAGAISVIVIR